MSGRVYAWDNAQHNLIIVDDLCLDEYRYEYDYEYGYDYDLRLLDEYCSAYDGFEEV